MTISRLIVGVLLQILNICQSVRRRNGVKCIMTAYRTPLWYTAFPLPQVVARSEESKADEIGTAVPFPIKLTSTLIYDVL